MDFKPFGEAVAKRFKEMTATGLWKTNTSKDELWDTYLNSFPPGTNPIYKTRTEHDCSCCRYFVKTLGGAVTIVNGEIQTLWDITVDPGYQPVVDALAALVRRQAIDNIFLHPEGAVGTASNAAMFDDKVVTFRHFFVNLPTELKVNGVNIGPAEGDARASFDVMSRGLSEIAPEAVDTVLDLISQNSLYRGDEHTGVLTAFRQLQTEFRVAQNKDNFCWSKLRTVHVSLARIRNTAIGTLLVDLSNNVDLDVAVKAFEQKVAPANYKRPTALVTKAMIAKAKEKIEELGFMSALERRYATIDDITINNLFFADRTAKKELDVFDELALGTALDTKKLGKVEDIHIDDFLNRILPHSKAVELFFENRLAGNLVSLIAPSDPTAKGMFKWPNNFSWSYVGEVTDSIKERVKQAGGNVTGDFRASLSWRNHDDLDLHLIEPGGFEIYYGSKYSPNKGELDVDMNAGIGTTRTPVENISYRSAASMRAGTYKLFVNQFNPRESDNTGFEVELEFMGTVYSFGYPRTMRPRENVTVATFQIKHTAKGPELVLLDSLPHQQSNRTVWGLPTQTFQEVKVVMLSPNHWDGRVGNKHYFFMLNNCRNEGRARGFFNEFLSEELTPHRKVLEIVGAKMKTDESEHQLSGLGFSSTQRNSVLAKVHGSFTRVVNITF
jgi:hypothetical protein